MGKVKREFIRQVLEDEGQRLMKNQESAIRSRLKFHSGRLLNDREVTVESGNDMDGKLEFRHPVYERFLDMKRKVKKKRGSGSRIRAGFRIHNRFMFGHYGSIADRLMYEFTEDVAEKIRQSFERNNQG